MSGSGCEVATEVFPPLFPRKGGVHSKPVAEGDRARGLTVRRKSVERIKLKPNSARARSI